MGLWGCPICGSGLSVENAHCIASDDALENPLEAKLIFIEFSGIRENIWEGGGNLIN